MNADRESPEAIKKAAEQSFTIASNILKNPREVRHPSGKSNIKLLAAYPLLPDLETINDVGGYVSVKYMSNPVPPSNTYDIRLDASVLKPIELSEEEEAARTQAREDHERDPTSFPPPDLSMNFNFFMPETPSDAINFKRKFDAMDPEKDSDELCNARTKDGLPTMRLKHVRPYESASGTSGAQEGKYDDEVVIAVHDGTDGLHEKAAYYYPIMQKIVIKPQRNRNIHSRKMQFAPGAAKESADDQLDYMDVFVVEPDEEMKMSREVYKTMPYGPVDDVDAEAEDEAAPAAT